MKKNFLVTLMLVGGLFMSSCTEDIYNPDKVKEDYEQNFVDLFGEIDPNQDWNVAELKSVTVDPGSSTEVQIYAKNGDVYKLVGDYKEVSGTRVLTFDAAKGVDDFYVVAGGQGKLAKNGESVSFADAGTRSYEKWDLNDAFTVKDDYVTFPWNDVMAYAERLPNDPDGDNLKVDGISTNFDMVMGNDKITVYPVYWNASFKHTLGIYWHEGKEKKMQDIYTDKEGNDVQVYVKRTEDTRWRPDTYEGWENVTWNTFEEPDDVTTGWWQNRKTFKGEIDTSKGIKSRGFTIDLPYGTKYGFYIKVNDDDIYYTDASLNGQYFTGGWWPNREDVGEMAAYFKQEMPDGTTRTFVGFEDQPGNGKDLNDLMFMIDPSPIVIDNDVQEWIIAAEDLGSTDDYDFNDVVFSVKYASGNKEATITPLAAGGSKETYLYRGGEGPIGGVEFHTLLGGSVNEDGSYAFVNTESAGAKGEPIVIDVPVDFSLAYGDNINMGGFSLEVDGIGTSITAPGQGESPQMICVPAGWKWPKERVRIDQAYPKFGEWGENYTSTEWYTEPVSGQVIE